jgi:hypothetical protein
VPAPLAVKVAVWPVQTPAGPAIEIVGLVLTVTDWAAVAVHPPGAVTVTPYTPGWPTVMLADVLPLLQAYEPPPEAVSTVLWPEQITGTPVSEACEPKIATTVWAVAVQPLLKVTVTV